jgi:hypothetical protein
VNDDLQKALAACLEPVVDAIVAIETRVDLIQAIPGKDGKDADAHEVAVRLAASADFLKSVTPIVPIADVAHFLKADPDFVLLTRGAPGEPGEVGERGPDGAGIHAKTWKAGDVHRAGEVVTAFCGQYFMAQKDTADTPGASDHWERIGTQGFRFVGIRPEDDASLKSGDLYIDGGSLFYFDGERARMWVQRGKTGPQGDKGRDGINGANGTDAPRVVAIEATAKGFAFAFDNGQVLDANLSGLDDLIAAHVERRFEELKAQGEVTPKTRRYGGAK